MSPTRNRIGVNKCHFSKEIFGIFVCWLTYTQSEVEQSHPDVQSEEQNNIGHFAEQDDVAHVLLHSY